MRSNCWLVMLSCAVCIALLPARAQTPDWPSLDATTRDLLAPWHDGWADMDAASRARLIANANRWEAMNAQARDAFQHRSADWQALAPDERARRRARYAAWIALAPTEQSRVRVAAAQFAALPAAQQAEFRARFATQDADQQRAWLLGPGYGAWIGQARSLFTFVPANERDATLRMLQSLSADARTELLTLARRLPENQREQLRQQLLKAEPLQREALLRQRLAQ